MLFAILVVLGSLAGMLAKRLRLPSLTGQVFMGILLGESALHLINHDQVTGLGPLSAFALSLVAVTIGGHLEFRRLHNARRRILLIAAGQTTVTFFAVYLAFLFWNPLKLEGMNRLLFDLIIASLATSTSPVATMHLIKEKRAKGPLVKTSIAVVAINNLITIALFELTNALTIDHLSVHHGLWHVLLPATAGVLIAILVGLLTGYGLDLYCKLLDRRRHENQSHHERSPLQGALFTGFLVAVCLAAGLCDTISAQWGELGLHPSAIIANMVLGLVLANRSAFKSELLSLFQNMEHAVFVCFYVLAGLHFKLDALALAGPAALLFFLVRAAGKMAGGYLGSRLAKSTERRSRNIGLIFLPQGALVVALTIVVQQEVLYRDVADIVTAMVLSAAVLSELIGAPLIGRALERVGEASRDRLRLIEFLQEEYILVHLQARDKWEVLEALAHFACRTQRIPMDPHKLYKAIEARELEMPTDIGKGVAVPHARISFGNQFYGVLAQLDEPVAFSDEHEPCRIVVLVVTPEDMADKHLAVIAAIARMLRHKGLREAMSEAATAEELYEIIDSEEAETFNYFLET